MPSTLFRADLDGLSRRDFLKLTGFGLAAMFYLPRLSLALDNPTWPGIELPCQGRVLLSQVNSYSNPSFSARILQVLKRDEAYEILNATYSEDDPAHNHTWYQIQGGGFVHSAGLQPMQIHLNEVGTPLTPRGQPAEVTVPFSNAVWSLQPGGAFAYRLYYGAVFWVDQLVKDDQGGAWYRIVDEGQGPIYYYARAEHLHLVTAEDVAPISPDIPAEKKRIEVRLKDQVVIAYENNIPVMMTRAATGAKFSQKDMRTPLGRYFTNYKFPSVHMVHSDNLEENAFDLPGVPWVSFLTTTGVAFHGTYWHNDYGLPRSHGCINLNLSAARWLYRWSIPNVPQQERTWLTSTGTIVDVS
jgi:hypothetical protein